MPNNIVGVGSKESLASKSSTKTHHYTIAATKTLQNRQQLFAVASWLKENGIQLILVKRVHSKIVIADSALLCIGSFNWFSAARQGQYVRHETSLVYRGTLLQNEIEVKGEESK